MTITHANRKAFLSALAVSGCVHAAAVMRPLGDQTPGVGRAGAGAWPQLLLVAGKAKLMSTPNLEPIQASSGHYVVKTAQGKVTYCGSAIDMLSFQPQSICAPIGSVGTSARGFAHRVVGDHVYIMNVSQGALYDCVGFLLGGSSILGNCTARAPLHPQPVQPPSTPDDGRDWI